jgi:tetratricopeptide (TPR) repeat protein
MELIIRFIRSSPARRLAALFAAAALFPAAALADTASAGRRHSAADTEAAADAYGAYLTGRFAAKSGDADRAAGAFLRALTADPGNTELMREAYLSSLLAGRPDALILARKLPDDLAAQMLLADADIRAGRWAAALARYETLKRDGLSQVMQPLLVAWAQAGGGHTDAALLTLRPYAEGQRFRGVYSLHAALIADLGGRVPEANRLYQVARTEYGGMNLRLAQVLASWQTRQGRKDEAEQTLRSLADQSEELGIMIPALREHIGDRPVANAVEGVAEVYLDLAASLQQENAGAFAQVVLRLALDARPDFSAARALLADSVEGPGREADALAILAPIKNSDPSAPLVRMRRAALLDRMGKREDAIKELQSVAHDYPASPYPLAQLADIYRAKEEYTEALAALDEAIGRLGGAPLRASWTLFYARGVVLERAHRWPEAEADFKRALDLSPDQPAVLNYLGYTWADQGDHLDQAQAMIEKAVRLRPEDGAIIDSLGWVELRRGDVADAVQTLEKAAELQPEDGSVNYHLGEAYWAAGRKREALFQWRFAKTLKPEASDLARLEDRLRTMADAGDDAPAPGTKTP